MEPIKYEGFIDVRFSDLDPYGHVNAKHYLDFVTSSRFTYMEKIIGVSNEVIIKKGYQFFLRSSQFEYIKSVNGCERLFVSSYVSSHRGPRMKVEFEILSEDKSVIYCNGSFEFLLVDSNQKLVRRMPAWIEALFIRGVEVKTSLGVESESTPEV